MSVIIRNGDGSNMTAKLLYVEDNPYSVYLMQFYLRRHQDYKLTIATDGQSGWEQALLQEPDLIMMDINLPDINGWELTRKLKAHPLTKNIPIIAVTSLTMEDNYLSSQQAGIDLHFSKATDYRVLFRHVQTLINNQHNLAG